jgi:hypothetical protein
VAQPDSAVDATNRLHDLINQLEQAHQQATLLVTGETAGGGRDGLRSLVAASDRLQELRALAASADEPRKAAVLMAFSPEAVERAQAQIPAKPDGALVGGEAAPGTVGSGAGASGGGESIQVSRQQAIPAPLPVPVPAPVETPWWIEALSGMAGALLLILTFGALLESDSPRTRMCATEHPEMVRCDALPPEYRFASAQAALNALKAMERNPRLSLRSPRPSTDGPCPDVGTHWGVRDETGRYVASISCCPCCTDTPSGPVTMTRCRII